MYAKKRTSMTKVQLNELRRAYRATKDGAERTRYQAVWLYGQVIDYPPVLATASTVAYRLKPTPSATPCDPRLAMPWR